VDYGQQAVAMAMSQEDLGVRLIANAYLGAAYYNQGDWPGAITLFRANIGLVSGSRARERFGQQVHPSVFSLTYLAWCLAEQGEFAEGAVLAGQGVDLAEDLGQPFTRAVAHLGIGGFRLREGTFDAAAVPLEKGLALCREWDIPYWVHWITARLGYAYAFLGRREEAASLLETAVKHAAATRYVPGYSQGLAWMGEVHLHADRTDAAREAGTTALDNARRHGERGIEAWALRLLGDVASHADAPGRATGETHYNQAIALATELGMRPLVAHCHLGLGKLYRRIGDRAKAEQHLITAATMYREMGMTFWLEQAEAALEPLHGNSV
jgi:tetratricopeptide (TPR) repeat protein